MPGLNADFWPVDNLNSWRVDPMEAFRGWLAHQRIQGSREFRESSVETYTAMFSVWVEFLTAMQMTVIEAHSTEAANFFAAKNLEAISRRRYLQLLDRVYVHLYSCGRPGVNPIQAELNHERELERALPPSLTDTQLEDLIAILAAPTGWRADRDRALAALLIGAGLRANEITLLELSGIDSEYVVQVRTNSVHRPHQSLVVPDGVWRGWLSTWCQVRQARKIPGQLVIPGTSKGGSFEPSGQFRCVKRWMALAELDAAQSGPNILRNTFARKALECGRYTVREVQEFLGHHDSRATILRIGAEPK